jgi:hypothetical protein
MSIQEDKYFTGTRPDVAVQNSSIPPATGPQGTALSSEQNSTKPFGVSDSPTTTTTTRGGEVDDVSNESENGRSPAGSNKNRTKGAPQTVLNLFQSIYFN